MELLELAIFAIRFATFKRMLTFFKFVFHSFLLLCRQQIAFRKPLTDENGKKWMKNYRFADFFEKFKTFFSFSGKGNKRA